MSDEVKDMDNSTVTVDSVAEEEKANKESDVVAEISKAVVQFDCLDETPSKSTDSTPKKIAKSKGGLMKLGLGKSDARTRQKVGNNLQWYNNEKSESSQANLLGSKWLCTIDESFKSDDSAKGHSQSLVSSESDIFPGKGGVLNNFNETFTRPQTLYKSSSSSQIPTGKGNSIQSNKQLKFGGTGTAKPISVISVPQSYVPHAIGKSYCCCAGNCCRKTNRTESSLSLTEDVETPEGLSWRRLHMSRAKLKATATTSELLSGFAMVAMVELQINKPTAVPEWLFVLFAVCTTILVSVHIFALMISTYLLPNIDAVSKLHVSSLVTESPHDRMKSFIELAWAFSTILGLFLFLVEIAILCWVKFWDYSFTAAISATMIVIPVLVLFVAFAIHFYHSLVVIKCKTSVSNIQELENIKRQLDNVSPA